MSPRRSIVRIRVQPITSLAEGYRQGLSVKATRDDCTHYSSCRPNRRRSNTLAWCARCKALVCSLPSCPTGLRARKAHDFSSRPKDKRVFVIFNWRFTLMAQQNGVRLLCRTKDDNGAPIEVDESRAVHVHAHQVRRLAAVVPVPEMTGVLKVDVRRCRQVLQAPADQPTAAEAGKSARTAR